MGQSQKEEEATHVQDMLKNYFKDVQNQNFTAQDLWKDYKTPFGYNEMSKELNSITDKNVDTVNRNADNAAQTAQRDIAARLASQGITGGSVLNQTAGNAVNDINTQKFNSIKDILNQRSGQNINLMNLENQNKFATTTAGQNQINENMMNLFRKYGLSSGALSQMISNTSNMNDKTTLDDILAVANAASKFLQFIPSGGAGAASGGG